MKKYSLCNEKIITYDKLKITPDDRMFRFGDGTFQTVKIFNYVAYDIESYVERIKDSCKILEIDYLYDDKLLYNNISTLIKYNSVKNGTLRITISRGVGSMGYLPTKEISSILIANCYNSPNLDSDVDISVSKYRSWDIPLEFCSIKNSKSINYILTKLETGNSSIYDNIILSKGGLVTETSSCNIFWIKDGAIHTPDSSCGIYPGNIRSKIMKNNIHDVKTGNYYLEDLLQSDEVFLTNSNIMLRAVKSISHNGKLYKKRNVMCGEIRKFLFDDLHRYCSRKY